MSCTVVDRVFGLIPLSCRLTPCALCGWKERSSKLPFSAGRLTALYGPGAATEGSAWECYSSAPGALPLSLRTAKESFRFPPTQRSGTSFSLWSRLLQRLFPQALCCKGWKVQSPKPIIRKVRRSFSDPVSAPGSAQSRKLISKKSYRGSERKEDLAQPLSGRNILKPLAAIKLKESLDRYDIYRKKNVINQATLLSEESSKSFPYIMERFVERGFLKYPWNWFWKISSN